MAVAFGSIGADGAPGNGLSGIDCTMPASTVAGDLLVAPIYNDGGGTPVLSGWSLHAGSFSYNGGGLFALMSKLASGSEGSPQTFTGIDAFEEGVILRYTGADATTPINAYGTASSSTAPSITTTVNGCMEVAVISWDNGSNSTSPPAGWTTRQNGGFGNYYIAERLQTTAGATGTTSFASSGPGTGNVGVIHFAIAPASGAATKAFPFAPRNRRALMRR